MQEEQDEEERVRLNMWVARDVVERLQMIKKETGRTVLDLVREALWRFVKYWEREHWIIEKGNRDGKED